MAETTASLWCPSSFSDQYSWYRVPEKPKTEEEIVIEKLADFVKPHGNIELPDLKYLIKLGRESKFDIDEICEKSASFYDDKCAEEFNKHPETKYNSVIIRTSYRGLIDSPSENQDGKCRPQLRRILLQHPKAKIVIWPHLDMNTIFNMPISASMDYYEQITAKFSELQLYAESVRKFEKGYDCRLDKTSLVIKAEDKCFKGRVYFVNLPAIHVEFIAKTHKKNHDEFEKLWKRI